MIRFVARRIGLIIITLLVVSLAIFIVTEMLPGDVAAMIMGQEATEANLARLREELGLNRPAPVRYFEWISNMVLGDLGNSLYMGQPIAPIMSRRLGHSAILAVFALLFGIPLAVAAGIWSGIHPDTKTDRILSIVGLVGISIPQFVIGVLLILLFSSVFHLLPSSSIVIPGTTPLTRPQILIMPTITITTALFAYIMRMTRVNVMDVMQTDYIRTAILKGLPMHSVILRHVLPNAMLPTITVIAVNFGWMLGGLIIVENVFAYPGMGQLLLQSINTRDVPLLEVIALFIAMTYAVSNLVADLSYAVLDPRVRLA